MNLERKIILSFAFLALLLIGIGFLWEFYYTGINNEQFQESKNATLIVDHTNQMEVGLYQTLIYLNLIHETRTSRENIKDIRDTPLPSRSKMGFNKGLEIFHSSSKELEEIIADKPLLLDQVYELNQRVVLYESLSKEWLELEEEFVAQSNILFLSSIAPYFLNNIIPKFEEIRMLTINRQDLMINNLDAKLKKGRIINYFATFVILVIGVVIALYLYRSIINPLQNLTYSVKRVGEGYLDQRVEVGKEDEFSYVAKEFNEAGVQMLELKKSELVGEPISTFFNLIEPKESSTEIRKEEYQLQTLRNNKVPVLFSESALIEDGERKGSVIVVRDITELKNAENEIKKSLEEKNVMLAEIHHRVKNNLAVISGLIQLQILQTQSEEVNKVLTESQLRVKSIALVHEKLYASDSLAYIDYGKYIEELIQNIGHTFVAQNKKVDIITDVKNVSLNVNQAIPCSLLINEVLVNAYKHAFTETDKGKISIKITEVDGEIDVEITDDGKGLKSGREERSKITSLGFTLMKTLTGQLKGTYLFENRKGNPGTVFKLSFMKEHR